MDLKMIALPFASLLLWVGGAQAEQITVRQAQYSNDRTARSGRTEACIVNAAAAAGQPSERIEVQLLAFPALIGWKASVAPQEPAGAAPTGSVADVRFLGVPTLGPRNLRKANTPKGGLMAYLIDMRYAKPLLASFFQGNYAVEVVGRRGVDGRSYRIAAPPPKDVFDKFQACVDDLTRK